MDLSGCRTQVTESMTNYVYIYAGETSLNLAGPRFGAMDSTSRQTVHLAVGSFERGVMIQFMWYSESLISLPVWICQGAEHR